jgi:hypothetical protein
MVYGIFRLIAPIGASRALNVTKFGFLKYLPLEMELPRWRLTKNFRCWKISFAG